MNKIGETELILTKEKKIYHLNLKKEEIGDTIILVGDPSRVKMVSNKFDEIQCKITHREFTTHTGKLRNKKISVISTGIGTDNIDIVVNELDALVNIDFKNRQVNKIKRKLNIIRLGTSGAIQKNIKVNSIIASEYALGFDNLAYFYEKKDILIQEISKAYISHTKWPIKLSKPYVVKSSNLLLNKFPLIKKGITATAPGFYAPQGRKLRLSTSIKNLQQKMEQFNFNGNQITNFEMECSALYYLGRSLGHHTLTICTVLGNRLSNSYSKEPNNAIKNMIDYVVDRI